MEDAFWIPEVPSLDHYLDSISKQESRKGRDYENPYYTMLFGGSSGEYLSKLESVSAWFSPKGNVQGMQFRYSVEINGSNVHSWGRPSCPWALSTLDGSNSSPLQRTLMVDGKNGERICRVSIRFNYSQTYPRVSSHIPKPILSLKVRQLQLLGIFLKLT
jgi:hypothetical protein